MTDHDAKFGFYTSILTAFITVITFAVAVMTPPLSGPFCPADCFEYPYSDIASRYPRDYYWMFPTMIISILFVIQTICVHSLADPRKKIFGQAGIALSVLSAAVLIPNYYVQVTVIQPSLLRGETEGIALITQFNPHGIFIALEEAGFLLMNLAIFALFPIFRLKGSLFSAMRLTVVAGFILAVFSLIYTSVKSGFDREYIFEVAIISIVWLELIVFSILLGIVFYRKIKQSRE